MLDSGLPVLVSDGPRSRPRLSFGAPLPVGVAAEADLIDLVLTERVPTWRVREALEPRLPEGWTLVDLYDVWLAGPALPGLVVAADYRILVEAADAAGEEDAAIEPADVAARVDAAARRLVEARTLPRRRVKGGGTVEYDLRPLLVDVCLVDVGPPIAIGVRTRFDPERGAGRPDEVVAALADAAGIELAPRSVVRERLVLARDGG